MRHRCRSCVDCREECQALDQNEGSLWSDLNVKIRGGVSIASKSMLSSSLPLGKRGVKDQILHFAKLPVQRKKMCQNAPAAAHDHRIWWGRKTLLTTKPQLSLLLLKATSEFCAYSQNRHLTVDNTEPFPFHNLCDTSYNTILHPTDTLSALTLICYIAMF